MSWHFLERWLERANQHSTLIGKFWITYLIVCRMVIIGSIGKEDHDPNNGTLNKNTMREFLWGQRKNVIEHSFFSSHTYIHLEPDKTEYITHTPH